LRITLELRIGFEIRETHDNIEYDSPAIGCTNRTTLKDRIYGPFDSEAEALGAKSVLVQQYLADGWTIEKQGITSATLGGKNSSVYSGADTITIWTVPVILSQNILQGGPLQITDISLRLNPMLQ